MIHHPVLLVLGGWGLINVLVVAWLWFRAYVRDGRWL